MVGVYGMKIFIVGDDGPEHNNVISVHMTYEGAFKAWNDRRLELLKEAKSSLRRNKRGGKHWCEMYERMVKSLSCKDPAKIDNYPHETPYIRQMEVKK